LHLAPYTYKLGRVVILYFVCVCVLWEDYRVKYTTHVEQAPPLPNIPTSTHGAFSDSQIQQKIKELT